jgi:hypothetical protein
MKFLKFGNELININQIYQIDLKDVGNGIRVAFFYHLAGSASGGHKLSKIYENDYEAEEALERMGIEIEDDHDSKTNII